MSPGTWPLPLRHLFQKASILQFLLADSPTIPGPKLFVFPFLCAKCPGFIPIFNYSAEKVHLQIDAPSQQWGSPHAPAFPPADPVFLPLLQTRGRTQEAWLQSEGHLGHRLANHMRLNQIPTSPGVSDLAVNPHLKWTCHRQSRLPSTPRTARITRWTLSPFNQPFSFSYF